MSNAIIETAKNVILAERDAISVLADLINEQFEKAVQAIHLCKSRIVVSGIGKSAIVAQKIVATFNSTGTPAIFMHAADAIHGDLGMIQKEDVVIILSKSGESPEIKVLLPLIKSLNNTIISIVGNKQSYLAKQSDIVLNSFVEKEACPHNLAPTSSTTVQMVLGDALAVCLIELKKFSSEDFAKLHPGGNLGKRFYLKVNDIYKHNAAPKVLVDADLKKVILEISKGRVGATAVTDGNNLLQGIITDGDVRRLLEKTEQLSGITAKDVLSANPKTISAETLAIEALELMKQFDLSQLIVTNEQNHLLGFIHLHDLIREGIF
ncbi:D-arabinose 5-phosphate isomerase [Arachidicoccus ginsenosidimutans]|uniref:KpsF/GutQ family sugar-phosphate isomerase n=1 Tax=Arachidicoccus sp. BS20 TaxID=1850526 RepID=UPI0007F16497|nr:KpsF/GutQ family sugar-phosphate isomerase [Arachidicoccus sp. BS20]ANI89036.1 D-arabinose 5-phosphate isomerase [Arachidicoccus sp. BS20]